MVRQSPTFARRTSGRGLFVSLRRIGWPATVSLASAKIDPSGTAAPRRFNMSGWAMATTSALIDRLQGGVGVGVAAGAGEVMGCSLGGPALASFGSASDL